MNQATLEWMRSDWNQRAREDAFYYAGFADWKQSLETFASSATTAVPAIECELARLPPAPTPGNLIGLEIGCGPGRLMAAMGRHFRELHGVDISDEMIGLARGILKDSPHLHPRVNNGTDLSFFPDEFFDFVYSYAVFQHIPSKPVVLNYLREARRVLKGGGIFRAQLDSLPEIESPDTWTGCSFSAAEIAQFARVNGFALLAMAGEGSHYFWVTLQRIEPSNEAERVPALLAVTTAEGARSVPQRGKGAGVSLWIDGAPATSSLADFAIAFDGRTQLGCYLHSIGPGGYTFVNAPVPRDIAAGPARVSLKYRDQTIGEEEIEILPVAREPRVLSITDAVSKLLETRITCGSFKATLEDVADPNDVSFHIGGLPAQVAHIECLAPLIDRYYFTVKAPESVPRGTYEMKILVSGAELAATVEIA
ncbi:MAG TPA: class I SAM-dependent methyltransferase [Bryobacteraceae bacterium]|jgi:SAM-dependent methyltransferase